MLMYNLIEKKYEHDLQKENHKILIFVRARARARVRVRISVRI